MRKLLCVPIGLLIPFSRSSGPWAAVCFMAVGGILLKSASRRRRPDDAKTSRRVGPGSVAFIIALAVLSAGLAVSGCGNLPQTTQTPVGDNARQIQNLFMPILWIAVAIFVLVQCILMFSLIKFRRRPGNDGIPPQIHGNTRLEMAWTVAPAAIVVTLAVLSIQTIASQAAPPPADALRVRVVAHQWWWEYEYLDEELGFKTANELHAQVGRTVALSIESKDVIHSFWLPQIAGKIDAVPGRTNPLKFTVPKVGIYQGQCSEFCGIAHGQMRFLLKVESKEDFDKWVAMMKSVPKPEGEAARGAEIFNTKLFQDAKGVTQGCFFCHAIQGTQAQGAVGPNLTGMGARTTIGAGLVPNNENNLGKWIYDPSNYKPGVLMPALGLSIDEIRAVVAYLHSLK